MRTEKIVADLCRRYKTRNPFEIASCLHIETVFLPLGEIKGYYSRCYRSKLIHINSEISSEQQSFTCAHELGHAVLHPDSNTPFLRTNTLFCINKFENEANRFAVNLLISDDDLKEYESYSVPEIALCFGIDEEVMKYRMEKLYSGH